MRKELTWKKAIEKVLEQAGTAMHYKDIAERIVSLGFRKNIGATPAATVNANITSSIKKLGENSPFKKVGKGEYMLATGKTTSHQAKEVTDKEETEERQYEIVTSFGMFWSRNLVRWNTRPQLLGMQQIGAEPVDFCKQQGIYLLYDGREVIYVGRATDRPLGRRLYEHTLDRLSARWNRFSWFGLLPVSDKGSLQPLPDGYQPMKLIPALEAILIEALEPRQNRKRGDDLSAVEYLQQEDPEIEKQRVKDTIATLLKKA
ncbi:MAG: hypothetical protein GWP10_14345 [Nitrospiraceae bacterium]|nr:hypothetical protein [Nitrospiraceae bacterium]